MSSLQRTPKPGDHVKAHILRSPAPVETRPLELVEYDLPVPADDGEEFLREAARIPIVASVQTYPFRNVDSPSAAMFRDTIGVSVEGRALGFEALRTDGSVRDRLRQSLGRDHGGG
jgi:hypothetical protein